MVYALRNDTLPPPIEIKRAKDGPALIMIWRRDTIREPLAKWREQLELAGRVEPQG